MPEGRCQQGRGQAPFSLPLFLMIPLDKVTSTRHSAERLGWRQAREHFLKVVFGQITKKWLRMVLPLCASEVLRNLFVP